MKRINIVCITLLMILLGVNTSCADYLDKAPDEDLTLDDVFTRENYAEQFLSSIYCIYNHRTTKTNQKYPSVNL